MPHVTLIVNPRATAVDERRAALVEQALARHADVVVERTQDRGHAMELARGAEDADAIFVFSGDGGFNEVVNGLGPNSPPLGCIPGGGTSVFPRVLGIPADPVPAAEHLVRSLVEHRFRTITLGRVNGRRFLFSAGIRLDAELVRRLERGRSRDGRPGDAAAVAALAKVVAEQHGRFGPALEADGLGRVAFLLVANADPYTYLGSIPVHIAPEATLEGGLDVVAAIRLDGRHIPGLLRYMLTGRRKPRFVLTRHDVDRIEARCDEPLPLQADGEDLGDVTEAVFEAERGALTVLS
ncbi:MAG TPA: diacylglycerol kinase family protein [Gaiellaceae bacterium]|nr:diacylglycerol kinase family protein [Gaiellaceae bacterium]